MILKVLPDSNISFTIALYDSGHHLSQLFLPDSKSSLYNKCVQAKSKEGLGKLSYALESIKGNLTRQTPEAFATKSQS